MAKLGADEFGYYLRDELAGAGVDVDGIVHTKQARTGLAFVELGADGERRFLFYRHPSADMTIGPDDVDVDVVKRALITHAGTNLLIRDHNREATWRCFQTAKAAGRFTSLDLNLRFHQWPSQDLIHPIVTETLAWVDLVKANDEELEFLCPGLNAREAFATFFAPLGVRALVLTTGPNGAEAVTRAGHVEAPAPEVDAVDTTGAGDGFLAGLLRVLSHDGAPEPERVDWASALRVGNFVGSRVCTAFGATTALPSEDEVPWGEGVRTPARTQS